MRICGVGHTILIERTSKVFMEMSKKADIKIIGPIKQDIKLSVSLIKNNIEIINCSPYIPYKPIPLVGGVLTSYMPKISHILKKIKNEIDIVYTMMEPFTLLTSSTSFLSKKYKLKHVFFTWENIDHEFYGIKKILSKFSYEVMRQNSIKYSDGIIAGNNEAKEIMIKHGFKKKIDVFPQTGIDIKEFNPEVLPKYKNKFNLEDKIVVLFAGNISYWKGLDFLIESVPYVSKSNKNVHFLICGDGILKNHLIEKVKKKNLENFVTFMDRVPYYEMPYVHASADIFVYPSIPVYFWKEQFGFSIVEAMATGKPVIVTNSGAMPEIVENDKSGFVIEPKNSKQIAEAILKLANDNELRKKMGKNARKRVEKNYSVEVIAEKTLNFLESVLN